MLIFIFSGHDTGPGESGKKYRPLFLDHFDKKEGLVSTSLQSPQTNDVFVQNHNEQVSPQKVLKQSAPNKKNFKLYSLKRYHKMLFLE